VGRVELPCRCLRRFANHLHGHPFSTKLLDEEDLGDLQEGQHTFRAAQVGWHDLSMATRDTVRRVGVLAHPTTQDGWLQANDACCVGDRIQPHSNESRLAHLAPPRSRSWADSRLSFMSVSIDM